MKRISVFCQWSLPEVNWPGVDIFSPRFEKHWPQHSPISQINKRRGKNLAYEHEVYRSLTKVNKIQHRPSVSRRNTSHIFSIFTQIKFPNFLQVVFLHIVPKKHEHNLRQNGTAFWFNVHAAVTTGGKKNFKFPFAKCGNHFPTQKKNVRQLITSTGKEENVIYSGK